ncbi:MAG: flagellar type III secretion system pore protein FliP [Pseudomonadota bacterium]
MVVVLVLGLIPVAHAQPISIPTLSIGVKEANSPGEVSSVVQILLLLTVLSLAPAILIMMTSFTRLAVVLSFLRHAMGTQQMPPNQIILGLALFLTFFIMGPVFKQVNEQAIQPYMAEEITQEEAFTKALEPLRQFMFRQTRQKDLALFISLAHVARPHNSADVPSSVLIPAFCISELKTGFQIGFILYIPFLIVDMVVASILLSMGMMMLPPIMVSLPFKLLLFVLVDGWCLIAGSLIQSFH